MRVPASTAQPVTKLFGGIRNWWETGSAGGLPNHFGAFDELVHELVGELVCLAGELVSKLVCKLVSKLVCLVRVPSVVVSSDRFPNCFVTCLETSLSNMYGSK